MQYSRHGHVTPVLLPCSEDSIVGLVRRTG